MKKHLSPSTPVLRNCVVIVVLAMLLSGCFRTNERSEYQESSPAAALTVDRNERVNASAGDDASLPLSEFLGYDHTDAQATAKHFATLEQESDLAVAECMRRQGFEYINNVIEEPSVFTYHETELADHSPAWVAKYGFGVSTLRWSQDDVGADLVGYPGPSLETQNLVDPNTEYLNGLSDAQRDAWHAALFGPGPTADADSDQSQGPRGCHDAGFDQAFGQVNALWDTFGDELADVYDRASGDPRAVHYFRQVNSCVAEAGFEWDSGREPWEYFEPKLRDIGGEPEFEFSADEVEAMSEAELDAILNASFELSDSDKSQLADIQAEELVLAQAVAGCGGGVLDQVDTLTEIYADYEQQFVDLNFDKLSSLPQG